MKSTTDEIRRRFDADVDRFSNLETGQSATIDAPLTLELVAQAAAAATPGARDLLDVGCGAGNYSLRLLERLPDMNVSLMDLSAPMLQRAVERTSAATRGTVTPMQGDLREIDLGEERYDVVVAGAVLHHLRTEAEWRSAYAKLHRALRPGGSLWVCDLVAHSIPAVQEMMWARYGDYLVGLKDEAYREKVFAYVEAEDSPTSCLFQLDMMKAAGFGQVDLLHKNSCFAAFGGVK